MSRLPLALRVAGGLLAAVWWVLVAFALSLWWAPAILIALAALMLGRARFWVAIGLSRALREVGAVGAARWVCRRALARIERRKRALARPRTGAQ